MLTRLSLRSCYNKMSNPCAVCKAPSQQRCAMCKNVHYCSKAHQKQHWKTHKHECISYKVVESDKIGRYVVASRNISAGEVIMKEDPLVIGPKVVSFPLCLGCHRAVKATSPDEDTPLSYYYCPDCGWPLCAPRCRNASNHLAECRLMKGKNFQNQITHQTPPKKESAYCTILPLRCLLLEPPKLKMLLNLESHLEERRNTQLYKLLKVNIVGFIRECLGLKQFDEETILTIAAVLDTNAFEVRRSAGNVKVRGLYPQAAMLSHDCRPNTKHNFVGDEYTLVLTATQDIKKGDIISATYTQTLWGTQARRAHLMQSKCFNCTCNRCADPYEFDTYLSCILCSKCKGYVVCHDPLETASDWACQSCSHKITARQMLQGNDSFKKELEKIDKSVGELESLIERYLKDPTVFHERNYHIVQAKYALSQLYGNMLTELSDKQLENAEKLCKELLALGDILDPGLSRFRGSILYDLQAVQVVQIKRQFDNENITKEEAQEAMGDVMVVLQEATKILSSEPDLAYLLQHRVQELSEICI